MEDGPTNRRPAVQGCENIAFDQFFVWLLIPFFPVPFDVGIIYLTDEYDAYIIVSFVNATLVLSIGETGEEVTDSGFLGTTPTLSCSQLGDDALVQVNMQCKPGEYSM